VSSFEAKMFRNYLVIALRNLKRQKGYSALNIFGLSVGIAASILIVLFVQFELSYDKFHQDLDRIHRVVINFLERDGSLQVSFADVAAPYGKYLKGDFPEVEYCARMLGTNDMLISYGEKNIMGDNFCLAEKDIFKILTIPFVSGNPELALANPQDIIISQSTAKVIFGDENPIGKELIVDGEYPYYVTGVMEDYPENTHVRFDYFVPFVSIKTIVSESYWERVFVNDNFNNNNCLTYIKLHEGVDAKAFDEKIRFYIDNFVDPWTDKSGTVHPASERRQLELQNVGDIHLVSVQNDDTSVAGDIRVVRLFCLIAAFVLFIACINFMNMATARSASRAREVGLRKVIGANRGMLISQFLGESLIISFLSTTLGIVIANLALPYFSNFVGHSLSFNLMSNSFLLFTLCGIFVTVGLLAGIYPAFYLSSFKPNYILRGEITRGKKGVFTRKALVVFQFIISAGLIVCVSVVFNQLRFMNNADLGFNKENVLIVQSDSELRNNWGTIKKQLERIPGVISVTASKRIPSGQLNDWGGWRTEVNGEWIENTFRLPNQRVGFDFFKTYGIDFIAGRTFSEEITTDIDEGVILSEMAIKLIGWTNPQEAVGKVFFTGDNKRQVLGVANDIHFESLKNEKLPLVYFLSPGSTHQISLRIAGGEVQKTITGVQSVWDDFHGSHAEMDYRFLDDQLNQQYKNDQKLMSLFGMFSLLAILISCLGLVGLSSFTAERRTREIGIRKVLGASIQSILRLLSNEFTWLVLLGSLIASPIVWYAMNKWLESFAYRTEIHAGYFIFATLVVLAIALISVLSQALRAASLNPTEALRRE